ncbi:GNAT family N-acetyltransferase [Chitinimonas sp.]|uniref:GNAT family N-acetyltransferase n=1 Tax=Chitinimonas sp. TaxID=1934313 RepID=UPI0035B3B99E
MERKTLIEQLAALDELTLSQHTEQAGDHFCRAQREIELAQQFDEQHHLVAIARAGKVVAYAMYRAKQLGEWFVLMLNVHPECRDASVMRELSFKSLQLFRQHTVERLVSHVYKTNRLSMNFHHRLGFAINQENDKAVEFVTELAHNTRLAALAAKAS